MGGRVAELLIFGRDKLTTGAANDIAQATSIARRMVTEWGMSDKLGPLRYNENQEEIFLGHSVSQQKNVSEATAEVIDQEVRSIVDGAEEKCRAILTEQNDDLHTLANALLEYETLSGDEIAALLRGEPIVREKDDDPEPPPIRTSVPSAGKPISPGPEPEPQGG